MIYLINLIIDYIIWLCKTGKVVPAVMMILLILGLITIFYKKIRDHVPAARIYKERMIEFRKGR